MSLSEFHAVCVTESWLKEGIQNLELFPPTYNVYRRDRNMELSGKSDGGGVLIGINSDLISHCVSKWSTDGIIEDLWVSIVLNGGKKLFICCVYVPPHAVLNNFILFFNKLEEIFNSNPNDEFIIVGDFNLSNITWKYDVDNKSYLPFNAVDPLSEFFVDNLALNDLKQFNNVLNCNGKCLDLIMSSNLQIEVSQCIMPFVNEDIHHKAFEAHFDIRTQRLLPGYSYTKLKFSDADYTIIKERLNEINWMNVLNNNDVDQCVSIFYNIIYDIINMYVPIRSINKKKYPIWFSNNTKNVIKIKEKYHRKWKRFKNLDDYTEFSRYRRLLKININDDYKKYIDKTEVNLKNDTKQFWSFLANKKSNKSLPQRMYFDEVTASDNESICNLFINYFGSVYEQNTTPSEVPRTIDNLNNNFIITIVSKYQIKTALSNLDVKKGPGPDGIPAIFLKMCGDSLIEPLYIIFNKCLNYGIYPRKWKEAQVIPVFKSGDKENVRNYRPISLLSQFGKVFESIITEELFFMVKNYINIHQHGFHKKRSVLTNLAPYVQNIYESMEMGASTCTVYTDFSKAFDKVHHSTLIIKLENFGVHGALLNLLSSYVNNRTQFVAINNSKSLTIDVSSGVPQGSHLGPLLFNIFLNDIGQCFNSTKHTLYADDLKIYKVIHSNADYIEFQDDLNRFCEYCKLNKFNLNVEKCHAILFSRIINPPSAALYLNNIPVKAENSVKDLGIVLDSKLSFELHVDNVVRRAMKCLGFILRISKEFRQRSSVIILFKTLVRPILEYATLIWNPLYDKYIQRIERVQKKFINTLNYRYNRHRYYFSYEDNLNFYKLETLIVRRNIFDVCFIYKIFNNMVDSPLCTSYFSISCIPHLIRHRQTFYVNVFHSNYMANSPLVRCTLTYNAIGDAYDYKLDIFSLNYNNFVITLKRLLNY